MYKFAILTALLTVFSLHAEDNGGVYWHHHSLEPEAVEGEWIGQDQEEKDNFCDPYCYPYCQWRNGFGVEPPQDYAAWPAARYDLIDELAQ